MERILKKHLPGGQFHDVKPTHRRLMQGVSGKGNRTTEARLRAGLARAGVRGWKINYRPVTGTPDFFFPQEQVSVFVDGCFWHGCPTCGHIPKKRSSFWTAKIDRNRQRDDERSALLRKQGIRVLRFWEHDLKASLNKCVLKIQTVLKRRQSPRKQRAEHYGNLSKRENL